ncbi:hypothetical protein [Gelatiniphilus marinus]|uniref:Uncharacterized protein n=1 Tax=Gelatiniphilus marinus TaxID=1759464 RepID=A0ABW5JYI3_9FLAO
MIDFRKEDIKPLDWIVNEVIVRYVLTPDDLVEAGIIKEQKGFEIDPTINAVNEFKRYLYVLDKYKVCDCVSAMDMLNVRSNEYTLQFKNLGGFKKLYADLKKQEKREDLEFELAESNIRANKLNKKVAKRNKRETIINIILGFINIGILIWQALKAE